MTEWKSIENENIKFFDFISYSESLNIQSNFLKSLQDTNRPIGVLGFNYHPVITLGKRSQNQGHIQWSDEDLQKNNIEVCFSERGGQATLHSPGQLVIYPLIFLEKYQLTIRRYVNLLEQATQLFLKNFGINSETHHGDSGVYLSDGAKIAFIGIKVHRGWTSHGIAINIANDLTFFESIISCGLSNRKVTSVQRVLSERGDQTFQYSSDFNFSNLGILYKQWINCFLQVLRQNE